MSESSSSSSFPSQAGLAILMAASLLSIGTAALAMYVVLVQIELHTTLSFGSNDDVQLQENSNNSHGEVQHHKSSASGSAVETNEEGMARRLHLPMQRRLQLGVVVGLVTFMIYLLLALSNANVILSWMGMLTVLGVLLRQAVFEEVRRERLDRLAALFSLVLTIAMAVNLAVYANRQHAQGDIYEGKARIVGYDYSSYTQSKDDTILRTDLEVAWGGWWGCPNAPDQTCDAFVSGALCETKEEDAVQTYDYVVEDGGGRRRLRQHRLLLGRIQRWLSEPRQLNATTTPANATTTTSNATNSQPVANTTEAATTAVGKGDDESDLAAENEALKKQNEELQKENANLALEKENEALEEANKDLEQQNADLEKQNEDLQAQIDQYAAYAQEEEEVIDEFEDGTYGGFEDDAYYDDYWGATEWNDVWGEYACEDLFATDFTGETYDDNEPPGNDERPFINIYGNCNTCEAFIVDYYSTEHFQSILSYKKAGLHYGILAGLSFMATAYFMVKQKSKGNKAADKEIELLPTAEGAMA